MASYKGGTDIARVRDAKGGSGSGGRARSNAEKIVLGERILREKIAGRFMVEIADGIGISAVTAYRYMRAALDRREVAAVEDFRKFANEHLDDIEQQVGGQIALADHLIREGAKLGLEAGIGLIERGAKLRDRSIVRRISIAERRARLNGLDAPVVVQATVVTLSEVDADLAAMVAEAERRMAAEDSERESAGGS